MQYCTSFPTDAEYEEVKRSCSILNDNSTEIRAVKDYANQKRQALERTALARSYEPPRDPDEDFYTVFWSRQDKSTLTDLDRHYSRHALRGASKFDDYQIDGAGAPFERLFFEARDQLEKATNDLAFERKDRAYERGCLDEWEDFNFIDTFLVSQEKLT